MKLKRCPFCGGKAEFGESIDGGEFVSCVNCDASSTMMYPLKEGVKDLLAERWNRRVQKNNAR